VSQAEEIEFPSRTRWIAGHEDGRIIVRFETEDCSYTAVLHPSSAYAMGQSLLGGAYAIGWTAEE
jgi:hypothetical protein